MKPDSRTLLVIAPDAGQAALPEIDSLFALGYAPQVVQGEVTRERLFQVIRNREFSIIHYAGHATRDGIALSDGLLDAASLVQIARSCNSSLVFLNGCETAEIGQVLVDEHVSYAICTLRNVQDTLARETAQLFYQALIRTEDFQAAYNMSKPPIKGAYTLLIGGPQPQSLVLILERLDKFEAFMIRNDQEHVDFLKAILAMKTWFWRISLGGMTMTGAALGFLMLIAGR